MLREIIIPDKNIYPLHLPDEFVGKEVEVIAFTVEEQSVKNLSQDISNAEAFYRSINIDMSNFKFNRDKAHER